METREVKPGMTYNPDTGNYTVRDVAGAYVGATTQADIAANWWFHASGCRSQGKDATPTRAALQAAGAGGHRVTCTAHSANFPAGWEAGHAAGPCGERSTHGACSFASPYGGAAYGTAHVAVFAGRYCAEHGTMH